MPCATDVAPTVSTITATFSPHHVPRHGGPGSSVNPIGAKRAEQDKECPFRHTGTLRTGQALIGSGSAASRGVRTRSTEITIATATTITAPPIRIAGVIGSSRISAPRITATTGFTYA